MTYLVRLYRADGTCVSEGGGDDQERAHEVARQDIGEAAVCHAVILQLINAGPDAEMVLDSYRAQADEAHLNIDHEIATETLAR